MAIVPFDGKLKVNAINAYTPDIMGAIHANVIPAIQQTKEFAQSLKGSSRMASAFNVWRWLRENITYQRDPVQMQMIRLPGRLIADRVGDCKSYSLLAASVLKNLGYPVMFRYTSYKIGDPTKTHIYVVTFDKNSTPIVVDGTLKKFNIEPPYTSKKDVLIDVKKK